MFPARPGSRIIPVQVFHQTSLGIPVDAVSRTNRPSSSSSPSPRATSERHHSQLVPRTRRYLQVITCPIRPEGCPSTYRMTGSYSIPNNCASRRPRRKSFARLATARHSVPAPYRLI